MKVYLYSLSLLILTACSQNGGYDFGTTEKGALIGTAIGAGLGAIVGNQSGRAGEGVAIGSGLGAIAGGLLGNQQEGIEDKQDELENKLNTQSAQLEENRKLIEQLRSKGADARETDRGVVVNLPDVLFEFDRSELTSTARGTVQSIADVVKDTASSRKIEIEGHTDSVGSPVYNKELSARRAKSVALGLINNGVKRTQVLSRGYGESSPLVSNETSAGRARNRRVEVVIAN